jgi:predicted nucleotidyltransferase
MRLAEQALLPDPKHHLCYVQSGMTDKPQDDPVLKRFRAAVTEVYGGRLERVILFGSRARGDAREDSDYDVAVFLHDMPDRANEVTRIVELETDILYDTGAVINALPLPAEAYLERTGFMSELRKDGVDL